MMVLLYSGGVNMEGYSSGVSILASGTEDYTPACDPLLPRISFLAPKPAPIV